MSHTFISYFNPCSSHHHAIHDFKSLKPKHKFGVVVVTIFASLGSIPICGIGGVAAFRRGVSYWKPKGANHKSKSVSVFTKTHSSSSLFEDFKPKSVKVNPKNASPASLKGQSVKKSELIDSFDNALGDKIPSRQKTTLLRGFLEVLDSYGAMITQKEVDLVMKQFKSKLDSYVANASTLQIPYVSVQTSNRALKAIKEVSLQITKQPKNRQSVRKHSHKTHLQALDQLIPTFQDPLKQKFFSEGIKLYKKAKISEGLQTFRLTNIDDFNLSRGKDPNYFQQPFRPLQSKTYVTEKYYDYKSYYDDVEDVWVDFANANLGGGCFDRGFVQEETMVVEMPDFAEHIAEHQKKGYKPGGKHFCTISVREGPFQTRSEVGGGKVNPYLLKGLHRVQQIDKNGKTRVAVPLGEIQKVNVLAIAAPKLVARDLNEQCSYDTARDLFNTIMAGFTLAMQEKDPAKTCLIHSGKFGCGDYKNNPTLVYLLHCLASKHTGVSVVLHGYKDSESQAAQKIWESLDLRMLSLGECINWLANEVRRSEGD